MCPPSNSSQALPVFLHSQFHFMVWCYTLSLLILPSLHPSFSLSIPPCLALFVFSQKRKQKTKTKTSNKNQKSKQTKKNKGKTKHNKTNKQKPKSTQENVGSLCVGQIFLSMGTWPALTLTTKPLDADPESPMFFLVTPLSLLALFTPCDSPWPAEQFSTKNPTPTRHGRAPECTAATKGPNPHNQDKPRFLKLATLHMFYR